MKILNSERYHSFSTVDNEVIRDIKEKFGYVALDFDQEVGEKKRRDGGRERRKGIHSLFNR
jgi:hypothetical protein